MSHEPDRERHMIYRCERCGNSDELFYHKREDEYWCQDCFDDEAKDVEQ